MTIGVIEKLGIGVVPYVVLLVVPVLGRMSDQCEDVRLMATYSFATLIRLMPLEVMIYVTPFSPYWRKDKSIKTIRRLLLYG